VGRASPRAVFKILCPDSGSSVASAHQIAVRADSKLKTKNFRLRGAPKRRSGATAAKLVSQLLGWFAINARDLPWRRTRNPYAVWVSEIMLQQTQVKTVIPFWERWMSELPTLEAAAKADSAKIHKLWEGLGYYTRVRNLQKAAQVIVAECRRRGNESQTGNKLETPHVVSYKFPEKFEDVLALPGIGRYTAGAICSIAFNQPVPILDGNVIRVLTRLFGIAENPKEKETNARLWKLADELVTHAARPDSSRSSRREEAHSGIKNGQSLLTSAATIAGSCSALNQSLMELGALICTPRNPHCLVCPVKKLCVAFKENRVEELPNLGKREAATARHFIAFAIERDGRFLVQQRPAGVVNAHLWEFPNAEVTGTKPDAVAVGKNVFGSAPAAAQPLCTVKHSITRYRITLEAFRIHIKSVPPKIAGAWKTRAQMEALAFTSAHRKVLRVLTARSGR
jgi:A/G-specific adenine glycosylase